MNNNVIMMLIAGIMLGPWTAYTAQPTNETFTGGANGWAGTTGLPFFGETGVWSFTGGAARVFFFNPGFPVPDNAVLSNTPSASSGSFTGNYDAAGIDTIGFSFFAPHIIPTNFVIAEWAGSTSKFQRGFTVATTGVWYHFAASLADEDRHQWTTLEGSSNDFAAARASVRSVVLRFSRNGLLDHEFVVDNLFVAGRPGGPSIVPESGGMIQWDGLLAGLGYHVQSTTNLLDGSWTSVESLTATGALHATVITNTSQTIESFRIRLD